MRMSTRPMWPSESSMLAIASGTLSIASSQSSRATTARDEVMDLAITDVCPELSQAGSRVRTVEAANGHDRLPGGQLVAGGVVCVNCGRRPAVATRTSLQQRDDVCAGSRALEEAGARLPPGAASWARRPS